MKAIMKCTNKRCRDYGKEVATMEPSSFRRATGKSITCSRCGSIMYYVRPGLSEKMIHESNPDNDSWVKAKFTQVIG